MAALGFVFCFLLLVWFTLYIVFAFCGTVMLAGELSFGEGLYGLVLLVIDIYLWVCLFDSSPFVLMVK